MGQPNGLEAHRSSKSGNLQAQYRECRESFPRVRVIVNLRIYPAVDYYNTRVLYFFFQKVHLFMYGLLFGLADTWAAMPDNKLVGKAIRDPEKLKIIASNPRRYTGKPRVGTMREIARQCEYVQNNFDKVRVPFLTAHGTSDGVTCPSGSRMLYEKASSEDKTLKIYEGGYHSLIQGEPDESADLVLADMRAWIDARV
ncbi:PREDICTED: caffeoylshikimate esterase [Erythranthe guttata]|uniref:caffeoylshikimate esterase n=1 Tax=Erythranthe guttata TaxID=4155 RepID=UPI00064D8548|nr:PREDICTED: caffeoylshikimate esterase [Erythranthe guttata]|eukprot:XP_012852630.1 PREDICTED: caffeoylshikimate esterase [Erythranthe guttata]